MTDQEAQSKEIMLYTAGFSLQVVGGIGGALYASKMGKSKLLFFIIGFILIGTIYFILTMKQREEILTLQLEEKERQKEEEEQRINDLLRQGL